MFKKLLIFHQNQDKIILYSILISLLSSLTITIFLLANLNNLPTRLPLFYSLPWGESYLASTTQFLTLPAVILLLTLINIFLSWYLHKSQIILKRLLNLSSAVISLLLLVTAIKIIYIFI